MTKKTIGIALASSVALALGTTSPARAGEDARVARGRYLVTLGGCNDCHTPLKMGQNGPEPDMARMLSGHPQDLAMPAAPVIPPGPWMATVGATMTAWSGPWGVSFTANLTPDPETGLGKWTEQNFIDSMRTGRHMGRGRQLLPPMPYQNVGAMTDEDLKSVFAFLRSIPAIRNQVPAPRPPAVAAK